MENKSYRDDPEYATAGIIRCETFTSRRSMQNEIVNETFATKAKIIGIQRHRWNTDGPGITTLVGFHGCPLNCKYCLNNQCHDSNRDFAVYTPKRLYDEVAKDRIYFVNSGGGITFGGGEPGLHPDFITEFRQLCGKTWHINVETSLYIPTDNIDRLLKVVDQFIIDIKDLNALTYERYTGKNVKLLKTNLRHIVELNKQDRCLIRVPQIPGFNQITDLEYSEELLRSLGFEHLERFVYKTPPEKDPEKSYLIRGKLKRIPDIGGDRSQPGTFPVG